MGAENGCHLGVCAEEVGKLLAVLMVHASPVVSMDPLIGALWDDVPSASARTTVQACVKQVRRRPGPEVAERIVTRRPAGGRPRR